MEKKWYVVRVINGKEKKTKQYMEHEIDVCKLTDYVSKIIIPTEKIRQIVKGKAVVKEKAMMPGYILIEAELNGEVKHTIKNVPGVLGFVGTKDEIHPLKKDEIERILGKMDDDIDKKEENKFNFITGEGVKIIDGPFTNFNATIKENLIDKNKLVVIVKIFGRDTSLELSYNQIVKEY